MSEQIAEQIITAIRNVIGKEPAGLHEPEFADLDYKNLIACLDTGYVSSVGEFVDQFERSIEAYTGAKYAVAVVNGTSALHAALKIAGVEAGDEVLVPTLSFVATANAVMYCSATPHFIDAEEETLGINISQLRKYLQEYTILVNGACINKLTKKIIRAIIPMHTFGHPVDMLELGKICEEFNILIVEDAAEALGSYYQGTHVGTFGAMGVLSFNGNKIITTGGGGAVLTNNAKMAAKLKHITTTAKIKHLWEYRHDEVGFNYRMPNLNASLGCAQLAHLAEKLEKKKKLHEAYRQQFESILGVRLVAAKSETAPNYWLETLVLSDKLSGELESILIKLNQAGYMSRPVWTPLHKLRPYISMPKMAITVADSLERRIINIPSSPNLSSRIK